MGWKSFWAYPICPHRLDSNTLLLLLVPQGGKKGRCWANSHNFDLAGWRGQYSSKWFNFLGKLLILCHSIRICGTSKQFVCLLPSPPNNEGYSASASDDPMWWAPVSDPMEHMVKLSTVQSVIQFWMNK